MSFERWQDVWPAFLCSEAVLKEKNADIEKFLNEVRDKCRMFDKVHVSEDDPRSVKFLVAYGREATFIAFRGARDFEYLGRDREKLPSSGDLHATVKELVDSFLLPDSKLLEELCLSGKRIIFCGHRLGGAVAQMVTVHYWKLEKDDSTKSEKNPDPLIAISFGAPQIWNNLMIQDFSVDPHLKKRFLNVSNDEDPLRSLLKDGLQGPPPDPESPTLGTQVSGKFRGVSIAGSVCPALERGMKPFVKPWKDAKFIKCYKSTVEDVLAKAQFFCNASADQPLPEIEVLSPAPKVKSASRKASDSGSFITIRGSNLLFLREKVKLNGVHPWDTESQTDECIRIFSPEKTKPSEKSTVVIKTAFGGTSHDVSEGNADGESNDQPPKLLSRVVQTYHMLATPGSSALDEVLADLDGIVQCVEDSIKDDEKRFSTLLRERAEGCSNIRETNSLVQKVTDFLDTSYEIHYDRDYWMVAKLVVRGVLEACLRRIPVGGVAGAVAGAATIEATVTTGAGAVAAVGDTSVMAVYLGPKKLMVEKYSDMLKLAIHEASLWNKSASNPDPKLPLTKLEVLLQQEVKSSGSKFDQMMKLDNDALAKDNSFESPSILNYANLQSKRNFLRRMHIVTKTVDLYHEKAKNIEFLGLVGEEDAGKSTFIKNVIERVGAPQDSGVPHVGPDVHTDTVTAYKLRDQFYLVDFPGSNGTKNYADAWVQFTALPSSCILLLDFKGDIKREQVQMYKQMQKGLNSKIAVVFNKVDRLYTPREAKVYTAKYFEDKKRKSAELLGCSEKHVHYVCLDPDPQERLTKLQAVGVLGFKDLAYKLVEWLDEHSDSKSHRVLKDLKTPLNGAA